MAFAQLRPPFAPETILRFVVLLLLDSEKFGLSGKSGAVQAECVGSSFTGDPFQTFARIRNGFTDFNVIKLALSRAT